MTPRALAEAAAPAALFPRLAGRLPIGRMGSRFYSFRTIPSTQDEVRRLAEAGAPEGTLVVADHQSRGRGRQGRPWWDEPGANVLFSLLLRPGMPPAAIPQLSLLAAVAAAGALAPATGLGVGIRWPNDLVVGGRKVAGVLAEAAVAGERVAHVALGIGINVNQTAFPSDLRTPATSLGLEAGRPLDREALLEALLASLERWYARYHREGFGPVRAAWREASVTLGHAVTGAGVSGTAENLDADGALLVRTSAGELMRLVAGELG